MGIRSLFLSLFLLATCNAFAPAASGRASTSLNDVRKVMWIGGKTQWEFEQSATYVGEELKAAAPKTAPKKKVAAPKKNTGLKVSSLPFGRPSVKVTGVAAKKAAKAPAAKKSAAPAFNNPFAKKAAPAKPAAAPEKKGGFKLPKLKFGDNA